MTETKASAALVTGIQAAGKSTVAKMLAGRFKRGAFVEGDLMWQMIVSGRVDMTPDPDPEAVRQLHLRYKNAALLVDSLVAAGFTTVHADIVLENDLLAYPQWVHARPLRIVVLAPHPEVVVARVPAAVPIWIRPYAPFKGIWTRRRASGCGSTRLRKRQQIQSMRFWSAGTKRSSHEDIDTIPTPLENAMKSDERLHPYPHRTRC